MYEEVPHQSFEPRAVVKEFHITGKEQNLPPGVMHKNHRKNHEVRPRGFLVCATNATHSCRGVMSVCLNIGRICVKIKTFVLLLAAMGEDIQHEGL